MATLLDNETTCEFVSMLPITLQMQDLVIGKIESGVDLFTNYDGAVEVTFQRAE